MPDFEHWTIALPEQLATELRASVEAGDYVSTNEAVQDAVRLWSSRREIFDCETVSLREAWDTGKAGGLHGTLDFDELRREARVKLRGALKASGLGD